ncbi:MAG: hypothetical protein PHN72_00260 [Bacilli bacterium]|nr:hypothetical protein [Bacilli bacterium]
MIRLSLIDKIKGLVDMISSSWLFTLLFIGFIILSIFLFQSSKLENKNLKKYFLIGYSTLLVGNLIVFHKVILTFLDHFMENLIMILCFPSMAFYIGILIFLNVVLFKVLFSKTVESYNKGIIITTYTIVHFLFILVLNTIVKNKIDILSKISIYTDKDLLNLIEISIGTVVIAGIILLIISIINKLSSTEIKSSNQFYLDLNPTLEPIVIGTIKEPAAPTTFYPKYVNTISVEEKKEELDRLTVSDYKRLKLALSELAGDNK